MPDSTRLAQARAAHNDAVKRMHAAAAAYKDLPADASQEDDDKLAAEFDTAESDEARSRSAVERLERIEESRSGIPAGDSGDVPIKVGTEERIYRPDNQMKRQFIADLYLSQVNRDPEATATLRKHEAQMAELRDISSGNIGGMVPPQYLLDLTALPARAGRPFANNVRKLQIPTTGQSFVIPRWTSGTAVAVQASDNATIQETDFAETDLTIPVRTIAGNQDLSRQTLERGMPGIDQLVFSDLNLAYATQIDFQTLAGSGTGGQLLGLLNTTGFVAETYTQATPAVGGPGGFYAKLQDAIQQINSGRFIPPDLIVMHPRRWAWIMAASDTSNRPLALPVSQYPMNAVAVGTPDVTGGVVGTIAGLAVVTDPNIPTNLGAGTNQDPVIVAVSNDILLWENGDGTPTELRFEQTLSQALTIRLLVYGYAAFTSGRYPGGVAVINGTGLVAPSF